MVQQPLHMYILEHLILDILYELGRTPSNQADKQKMNKSFSYEVNWQKLAKCLSSAVCFLKGKKWNNTLHHNWSLYYTKKIQPFFV